MDSTGTEIFYHAYQSGQQMGYTIFGFVFVLSLIVVIGKFSGRL